MLAVFESLYPGPLVSLFIRPLTVVSFSATSASSTLHQSNLTLASYSTYSYSTYSTYSYFTFTSTYSYSYSFHSFHAFYASRLHQIKMPCSTLLPIIFVDVGLFPEIRCYCASVDLKKNDKPCLWYVWHCPVNLCD